MGLFARALCLQMQVRTGDVAANLEAFDTLFAGVADAADSLVMLPELWATGFDYPRVAELADQTPLVLDHLQRRAREHGAWFAGSLLEKRSQGPPSNTLFLVGPEGVFGAYRKHHLFAFWQEDRFLQPGEQVEPLATPSVCVGGLVCYDLRFPEISRAHCFAGARLLVVSAQWPAVRLDHWQALVTARAVENQVYVAACNGCGETGFGALAGHSMIVAPDGRTLARAGTDPALIEAPLDDGEIMALRNRFCPAGERPRPPRDREKTLPVAELEKRLARIRAQGSRLVFTNGCFDILHAGHVTYLEQARSCGDCLVVGLNSDRSVRALKGESRPVNSEVERARVLAGLGCVDFVVIFDQETPRQLICRLLPDVLVKGADWEEDQIVGAAEVKAAGGRVERIVFEHRTSTSAVIEKIRQQGNPLPEHPQE